MPYRIAILIDNAHFQNAMRDEFGSARVDYGALAQKVAGDSDIFRAYVYDCAACKQGNRQRTTRASGTRASENSSKP